MLSIKQWRPRHLFRAWLAYWVALAGVTLSPAIMAILRVSGPGGKGSASAGFNNGMLNLIVKSADGTTWSGFASLQSVAFWIAGPPLVLWAIWLMTRPTRPPAPSEGDVTSGQSALGEGPARHVEQVDPVAQRDRNSRGE